MNPLTRFSYFWLIPLLVLLAGCNLWQEGPVPGRGSIIFQEQFTAGQTGNWFTEVDSQGQSLISDGRMTIRVDAPQTSQFSTLQTPILADFDAELDATLLEGSLSSAYGLLFRMQSSQEFYRFAITGNGQYVVEKRLADGSWVRLTETADWQDSSLINLGYNNPNRLRVVANGANLFFYINNELVAQVADGSYGRGLLALEAGTFNQPGTRAAFDNLVIREVSR
jgi:hypothetical protein